MEKEALDFAPIKEKPSEREDFDLIMKRNFENGKKREKERAEANRAVLKKYQIKK